MTPAALSRQATEIWPRYFDVAGLCAYLSLSDQWAVYRLVKQGLPASRLGRGARARYRMDEHYSGLTRLAILAAAPEASGNAPGCARRGENALGGAKMR